MLALIFGITESYVTDENGAPHSWTRSVKLRKWVTRKAGFYDKQVVAWVETKSTA
jgi:hypothetical protein